MNIAVIGAGAWGTAIACHLASQGAVQLFTRRASHAAVMRKTRRNGQYLAGVVLPDTIEISHDLQACCEFASDKLVILACATAGLRQSLTQLGQMPSMASTPLVCVSKGFEADTGKLAHEVAAECAPALSVGVLSGPSFAQEVAAGLPAALVVASTSDQVIDSTVTAFHRHAMRIYGSHDVTGVQVAGAMKNIVAIAAGICDGLSLGANARAALMTRGLAEIARLGTALGGRAETFMGLAGMGDLVLTCAGDLSRNRQVGLRLAKGQSLNDIVEQLGHVAEGARCVGAALSLARKSGVDLPIALAVNDVLLGTRTPAAAVADLLAREPGEEHS